MNTELNTIVRKLAEELSISLRGIEIVYTIDTEAIKEGIPEAPWVVRIYTKRVGHGDVTRIIQGYGANLEDSVTDVKLAYRRAADAKEIRT